ncbi:MAG: nickel-responsive transcriptional regulator NikR [bacterium]|nr:nickel-responsive transcriptional regulator NikR [bacterium]
MSELIRLSLSLEEPLYNKLDQIVNKSGYKNRSEFIRDMIRERLVSDEWELDKDVVGTVTLIYDHGKRNLNMKLNKVQHSTHHIVLASTHVHLTENLCAEMIMLKGKASEVKRMADNLRQQLGVLHSGLIMGTTGDLLSKE